MAKMWGEFLDFNFYEFKIKNSLYVKALGKHTKKYINNNKTD